MGYDLKSTNWAFGSGMTKRSHPYNAVTLNLSQHMTSTWFDVI